MRLGNAFLDEAWKRFSSHLTTRTLKKREAFNKVGDVVDTMGFVLRGCLRTFFTDEKGHEHIVQFAFEDWWAGDLMSFVTLEPSSYTVEALEWKHWKKRL